MEHTSVVQGLQAQLSAMNEDLLNKISEKEAEVSFPETKDVNPKFLW